MNESTTCTVLYACLCDYHRFSVTLMKNLYTVMHIRHHTCPIHLLVNPYLFLLPMPLPGLVSNYKRYISHIQSSPVTCREKKGAQKRRRRRYSREWNREGGEVERQCKSRAIFQQGPWWSCQAGVYVSPPDDNVAWHFWNESRVAMAKGGEGHSLQGPK